MTAVSCTRAQSLIAKLPQNGRRLFHLDVREEKGAVYVSVLEKEFPLDNFIPSTMDVTINSIAPAGGTDRPLLIRLVQLPQPF